MSPEVARRVRRVLEEDVPDRVAPIMRALRAAWILLEYPRDASEDAYARAASLVAAILAVELPATIWQHAPALRLRIIRVE